MPRTAGIGQTAGKVIERIARSGAGTAADLPVAEQ